MPVWSLELCCQGLVPLVGSVMTNRFSVSGRTKSSSETLRRRDHQSWWHHPELSLRERRWTVLLWTPPAGGDLRDWCTVMWAAWTAAHISDIVTWVTGYPERNRRVWRLVWACLHDPRDIRIYLKLCKKNKKWSPSKYNLSEMVVTFVFIFKQKVRSPCLRLKNSLSLCCPLVGTEDFVVFYIVLYIMFLVCFCSEGLVRDAADVPHDSHWRDMFKCGQHSEDDQENVINTV